MAYEHNSFLPGESAAVAANLVAAGATYSALIDHDAGNKTLEGGRKGRKIQVKAPVALVARARGIDDITNRIVMDTIHEQYVDLSLGVHAYSAVPLSEGDVNLDIDNFAEQVLAPQAEAVAAYANDSVLAALLKETVTPLGVAYNPAEPARFFTALRKALRDRGVPSANLNVLVGSGVYADLLDSKAFEDASQSGSTAALRDATIGKVRGFSVVEAPEVEDDDILAFHRSAYTLGMRAPQAPKGAPFAATVSEAGVPIRHVMDYDSDFTADRSILSTFCGVAKMPLWKVTRTQPKGLEGEVGYTVGTATVTRVTAGAVLRTKADETP